MPTKKKGSIYLILSVIGILGGYVSIANSKAFNDSKSKSANPSNVVSLYKSASSALAEKKYSHAVDKYERMIAEHPFGPLSKQALLDLSYAYINAWKMDDAQVIANRFIRLYPNDPNLDYAHYLRGVALNLSTIGSFRRYTPIKMEEYNVDYAFKTFDAFSTMLLLFPDSAYAVDAYYRMIASRNVIAANELHVADYYMKREAYLAAINRANEIVKNYNKTPVLEFALGILIESYKKLNLPVLAKENIQVLKSHFPKTTLLNTSGEFVGYRHYKDVNPSLLNIITFGLVDVKQKRKSKK